MSSSAALHSTLGTLFIGMVVANSLHGISIVQAYYYYRHQNDKWPLIALVTAVMIFDTVHQGLITHTVYVYVVSNWGNVEVLDKIVSSLAIENFFNALTALLVQGFLTARVWQLSNGSILLTTVIALFVLAGFASVVAFTVLELRFETFAQLITLKPLSLTVNILAAAGDLLIAVSLVVLLHLSRTGFQRSDSMINKLMLFAVNTGLLTSLCALASFIGYMTAPNTFVYVIFYFCIGRLYTNSLLATLNIRKMIRKTSDNIHNNNTTVTLHDIAKSNPSCGANISINIDTTRECDTVFNQEQDDRIEKSSSNAADKV